MAHIWFCVGLILILTIAVTAQTSPSAVEVSGVVLNTSEEVIPGASVTLRGVGVSKPPTVVTSDARGAFRFSRVASGSYEIEIQKSAFKSVVIQLTIGARTPAPLRVVLSVADLREEVVVEDSSGQVNTDPSENLDVVSWIATR